MGHERHAEAAAPSYDDRIFLSAKEVATMLAITPWSVYRLLDSGQIKSRYFGRRRLIVRESVQEFADSLPEWPT